MKRKVMVTIEKVIEVDIPDELLTPEAMVEFSQGMFPVTDAEDLFKYAAEQIAQYDDSFVEGLGKPVLQNTCSRTFEALSAHYDHFLENKEVSCEVDSEILED